MEHAKARITPICPRCGLDVPMYSGKGIRGTSDCTECGWGGPIAVDLDQYLLTRLPALLHQIDRAAMVDRAHTAQRAGLLRTV
jgi:hypothetical protein